MVDSTESEFSAVKRPKWVKNHGDILYAPLVQSSKGKYSLQFKIFEFYTSGHTMVESTELEFLDLGRPKWFKNHGDTLRTTGAKFRWKILALGWKFSNFIRLVERWSKVPNRNFQHSATKTSQKSWKDTLRTAGPKFWGEILAPGWKFSNLSVRCLPKHHQHLYDLTDGAPLLGPLVRKRWNASNAFVGWITIHGTDWVFNTSQLMFFCSGLCCINYLVPSRVLKK